MQSRNRFVRTIGVMVGLIIAVMMLVAPVAAQSTILVDPDPGFPDVKTYLELQNEGVLEDGNNNPTCADLGYLGDFGRIEGNYNNPDGYSLFGDYRIYFTVVDNVLSFQSEYPIDAINMKGGNLGGGGQVYFYEWTEPAADPGDTVFYTDSGLETNINQQGISHIDVCWNFDLEVEKDGTPSYTRTYDWTITKTAQNFMYLFTGDTADVEWEIDIDKSAPSDSNFAIDWTIDITNPLESGTSATITSFSDDLAGDQCDYLVGEVLAAGQTVTCTYQTTYESNPGSDSNTVIVEATNLDPDSDTATVTFGAPTTVLNDTVTFSDELDGVDVTAAILAANSASNPISGDVTFTYTQDNEDCRDVTFNNVASIVGDTVDESDDASATIYCETPQITKTAVLDYTTTYFWEITKTGTPDHELFVGESGDIDWTVTVTNTGSLDSDHVVSGVITISNPHAGNRTLEILSLEDVVSPGDFSTATFELYDAATQTCGETVTAPFDVTGASMQLCYSVAADGDVETNKATTSYQNYSFAADDTEATATTNGTTSVETVAVDIVPNAPTLVDDVVDLEDSYLVDDEYADLATGLTADGAPYVFAGVISEGEFGDAAAYSTELLLTTETCDAEGEFSYTNYAKLTNNETGADVAGPASDTVDFTCYELGFEKDAAGGYEIFYDWQIDKSIDPSEFLSDGVLMFNNDQMGPYPALGYNVAVSVASATENDWQVTGTITFTNPHPTRAALIVDLYDVVDPDIAADITDCSASEETPLEIPANGGTVECSYTTSEQPSANANPFGDDNNAYATQRLFNFDSTGTVKGDAFNGSEINANYALPAFTVRDREDECALVTDDWSIVELTGGTTVDFGTTVLGIVCVDAEAAAAVENPNLYDVEVAPHTFEYNVEFSPAMFECGENEYRNTATIEELDTNVTHDDSEVVSVEIMCGYGCSLTPGYWKTHAPEPFLVAARSDEAWIIPVTVLGIPGVTGPEMAFPAGADLRTITVGKGRQAGSLDLTYINVLWQPPQGDQWFNLARAFAATHLNLQNGADPSAISAEFILAYEWLRENDPGERLSRDDRAMITEWATLFDDYNNGLIGPGHCDDPSAGD